MNGTEITAIPCHNCDGTGLIAGVTCRFCHGSGTDWKATALAQANEKAAAEAFAADLQKQVGEAKDHLIALAGETQALITLYEAKLKVTRQFPKLTKEQIRERTIAGVRRAQAQGKHCGRPRVELDLRPALALLEKGHTEREVGEMLNISRGTLRRRLTEYRQDELVRMVLKERQA